MPDRYRFTLPDGRVHESEAGLAKIRKVHPDATITHRVVTDDIGAVIEMIPYTGKQAEPERPASEAAPVDVTVAEAPAKDAPKASGKKAS
jgi:hypothetical protein